VTTSAAISERLKRPRRRERIFRSERSVCYQMVRPEWVIEISCLDLISQSTRGAPIDRMVLDWTSRNTAPSAACRWRVRFRRNSCGVATTNGSFLPTCVFTSRRDRRSPLADRDGAAACVAQKRDDLPPCVHQSPQGQTMVRKLMLWKTNKEVEDQTSPRTSPTSSTSAPTAKRRWSETSASPARASRSSSLLAEMRSEYIVKGWQAV